MFSAELHSEFYCCHIFACSACFRAQIDWEASNTCVGWPSTFTLHLAQLAPLCYNTITADLGEASSDLQDPGVLAAPSEKSAFRSHVVALEFQYRLVHYHEQQYDQPPMTISWQIHIAAYWQL